MIPVGILTAAATSSFVGLLDIYPGASAAYSLRKLRISYTGNCIRVRRSSDNTETDIGFLNNVIDSNTLLTFCGAANGFVTIWYDQSGNANNGTATIFSIQSQIVFSGSLLLKNGKPYIESSPAQYFILLSVISATAADDYSWWFIYEKNAIGNYAILIDGAAGYLWLDYGSAAQYINSNFYAIDITPYSYAINTQYLVNNIFISASVSMYSNSIIIGNYNPVIGNSSMKELPGGIKSGTITMTEFVYYPNSQLSNRIAITNNINTFYSIYPPIPVVTVSDPDAQAFVDRIFSAGGSITQVEGNAVNTLTITLKSLGLWTLLKAIYPLVGGSAAACKQNLKSSSFTGIFSSGWAFTSNGIFGNGSTTYMDTTFTPSANMTLSSGHFSIYNRTNVEEPKCDIGTTDGNFGAANEILLMTRYTGLGSVNVFTQYAGAIANSDSRGFYITNRNSLTNTTGFKNNTKIYDAAQTSAVLPSLPFAIGCQNATTKTRFASKQYAFCTIGDGLTDTQASDLYTTIQTYQTTLGRQV
jgi:hypothetical protein